MRVSLVVAMDRKRGIGAGGKIPWHISSDLRNFKALTMGHALIMGRKTYESIGRPLPGREMIVISRNPAFQASGCIVLRSLDEALEFTRKRCDAEVFIIGGGDIFRQALPLADRIYLTLVDAETAADTYFPDIKMDEWNVIDTWQVSNSPGDDYGYVYQVLEKKSDYRTDPDSWS